MSAMARTKGINTFQQYIPIEILKVEFSSIFLTDIYFKLQSCIKEPAVVVICSPIPIG